MNVSEHSSKIEETNTDGTAIDGIHAELLHARSRQKKVYVFGGVLLLLAAIFTLGVIVFPKGTVIEIHPSEAQKVAVLDMVNGVGISMGHTVYSLSEHPTIEVSATGFRSLRKLFRQPRLAARFALNWQSFPDNFESTHARIRPGRAGLLMAGWPPLRRH